MKPVGSYVQADILIWRHQEKWRVIAGTWRVTIGFYGSLPFGLDLDLNSVDSGFCRTIG
jgi:hypothetical protein